MNRIKSMQALVDEGEFEELNENLRAGDEEEEDAPKQIADFMGRSSSHSAHGSQDSEDESYGPGARERREKKDEKKEKKEEKQKEEEKEDEDEGRVEWPARGRKREKEARAPRPRSNITVMDLFTAGLLPAGSEVVYRSHEIDMVAVVRDDARLLFEHWRDMRQPGNSPRMTKLFTSFSSFATYGANLVGSQGTKINGWNLCKYKGRPVDLLRQRLISSQGEQAASPQASPDKKPRERAAPKAKKEERAEKEEEREQAVVPLVEVKEERQDNKDSDGLAWVERTGPKKASGTPVKPFNPLPGRLFSPEKEESSVLSSPQKAGEESPGDWVERGPGKRANSGGLPAKRQRLQLLIDVDGSEEKKDEEKGQEQEQEKQKQEEEVAQEREREREEREREERRAEQLRRDAEEAWRESRKEEKEKEEKKEEKEENGENGEKERKEREKQVRKEKREEKKEKEEKEREEPRVERKRLVTLRDLLSLGILEPGAQLVYHDQTAVLGADGGLVWRGEPVNSLSTFATKVARERGSVNTAMNGWDCVKCGGRLLRLYRDQYAAAAALTPSTGAPPLPALARAPDALTAFLDTELAKFSHRPPSTSAPAPALAPAPAPSSSQSATSAPPPS